MTCLDSTFLIDLSRREESAVRRSRDLEAQGAPLLTTAPAFTEVMVGAYHLGEKYAARTLELFDLIDVVAVDRVLADEAARIGGGLRQTGVALDAVDLSVAALALRTHQSVLTRDQDFLRVRGLSVQSY